MNNPQKEELQELIERLKESLDLADQLELDLVAIRITEAMTLVDNEK